MTIFVGDDWAEDHHDVHLMDADGTKLASRRLPEGLAGIREFHQLVATHADEPTQVVIGIETDRVLARFSGRNVGSTLPGILTLKWFMVRIMTAAVGRKMSLIEINILEETGFRPPAPPKHDTKSEGGSARRSSTPGGSEGGIA